MPPIQDHPLRYRLANELHARPFPEMSASSSVVHIAIKQPAEAVSRDRAVDLAHLIDLLDRHGAPHPQPGATHYSGQVGRHVLKWEQHTEFVTYTAYSDSVSARAFDPTDFQVFPGEWLDNAPGERITSAMLRIEPRPDEAWIDAALREWFVPESLAVAEVLDGTAVIGGDFRIDPAGHLRFAVFVDPATDPRRIGRVVQRLCEIETYKAMSMLGFARVRSLSGQIADLDNQLTELMIEMTGDETAAEVTLPQLLAISAELETMAARTSFRFGATGAYEAIVNQRIAVLREERFQGRQTFGEFMMRRYEPAMRTVKSTETRLQALADRAIRAGDLLRTRVDVERSAQNQALLASMDRRADLQLRLQHTVEGLSVVAISYYAVSLAGYLLYPMTVAAGISKGMLTALITLPVVALVWLAIRRIRRKIG
ncbi:DUF3422 family protein [Sedimentitalea nanhaiensis]|uniref:Uncharacterized membrane-anchored protein n=1 Tax=Sedimentitalea nanhaiensis TaxID=999627 RepID=A0A1I7D653_9RHOB|nr:DUF3422 domain-containing protein [Sedimentitalea nanhaiensis]SFU07213.1 Uncharacterized membrane-anchored protein [Sedimentitalea nanhaiensis]